MLKLAEKFARAADQKGRVTLGSQYANVVFEQQEKTDGSIMLVPVVQVTVPKEEAWLFRNKAALESVKTGMKQAAAGKFAEDPRKKNDLSWLNNPKTKDD